MIRRSTWITLIVFLVLAAAGYGAITYKNQRAKTHPTPSPTPNDVITFTENDIVSVEIDGEGGRKVVLQRKDPKSPWQVVQPAPQGNERPDQQRISTAVFNITTLSALNSVPEGIDLNALGLLKPTYILKLRLANGKTWQAEIGKETPIGSGYYARANGQLLVVEKYAVDSIASLLNKPPLATPTPTPTPTPTSTPTPMPSPTPTSNNAGGPPPPTPTP